MTVRALRWRPGIRARLTGGFAVLFGIIAIFIHIYFPAGLERQAMASIIDEAHGVSEMTAYSVAAALYFDDRTAVDEAFLAARQNDHLEYLVLVDRAGRIAGAFDPDRAAAAGYGEVGARTGDGGAATVYRTSSSVRYNGEVIGTIYLGLSLRPLNEAVDESRAHIAIVSLLIFLAGTLGALAIGAVITGPLGRIVRTVELVSAGDLTQRVNVSSRDELGFLARSFDGMVERLESTYGELQAVNRDLEVRVRDRTSALEREVDERRRAEVALTESEHRFRAMFESAAVGIALVDGSGRIIESNDSLHAMLGRPRQELRGSAIGSVIRLEDASGEAGLPAVLERGEADAFEQEVRCTRPDGALMWGHVVVSMVRDAVGGRPFAIVMIENITERMELEERLRQSQKLEAVGRLAGGVAHDFNNLLTTINGVADLMLTEVPTPELRADLEEIRKAGARASSLTSQLLAFSRRQVLQPRVLDLNAAIREMGTMLRRLIGENIDLTLELHSHVHAVRADPGQIAQVLMNLAVNARDAMPLGGGLRIATSEMHVDAAVAARLGTAATGPHVFIEVADTGHGMSEETRRNAFEPFFTTKEVGKGTGLGLATVYGIVKQSGGGIFIDSAPGRGATFRILLPAVDPSCLIDEVRPQTKAPAGSETLLIVEDEDAVRSLVSRVLRRGGYNVLEGRHGPDALRVSRGHRGFIDAVLTDVIMPGMSGPDLVKQLMNARPSLKVLYMSGYTQDEVLHYGVSQNTPGFIQKPMSPDMLARKVREVLDAPVNG